MKYILLLVFILTVWISAMTDDVQTDIDLKETRLVDMK